MYDGQSVHTRLFIYGSLHTTSRKVTLAGLRSPKTLIGPRSSIIRARRKTDFL